MDLASDGTGMLRVLQKGLEMKYNHMSVQSIHVISADPMPNRNQAQYHMCINQFRFVNRPSPISHLKEMPGKRRRLAPGQLR